VLTLPLAGCIKEHFPKCTIIFMGRSYTKDVVALSAHVDHFINFDNLEKLPPATAAGQIRGFSADAFLHVFPRRKIAMLAKRAKIKMRIGTTNRLYHWFTCNRLIPFSRKRSPLHEAQLNFRLLSFLNIQPQVSLNEIEKWYGFKNIPGTSDLVSVPLADKRKKVILHPRSKGSAKEWGLDNFKALISLLPPEKFIVYISGTANDAATMKEFLQGLPSHVTDITGKFSLRQFIAFIHQCDALVAASTGPLHIAAALGKTAVGLFSNKRPIHPGRWKPVGKNAQYLVYDSACEKCLKGEDCDCIQKIEPSKVVALLQ
jgi:heptosyltransferase III